MQKLCHCQEALPELQSFTLAAFDLCIIRGSHLLQCVRGAIEHSLGCVSLLQPQDSVMAFRWAVNLSTGLGGPSVGQMQMLMPCCRSLHILCRHSQGSSHRVSPCKMNLPVYMHTLLSVSACFPAGGAAQAFILHAFGGVYLDPDVECLHPLDLISEQHTLILQSEPRPGMCLVLALLCTLTCVDPANPWGSCYTLGADNSGAWRRAVSSI